MPPAHGYQTDDADDERSVLNAHPLFVELYRDTSTVGWLGLYALYHIPDNPPSGTLYPGGQGSYNPLVLFHLVLSVLEELE